MADQLTELVLAPKPKRITRIGGAFYPSKLLTDAMAHYDGMHGPVPGVDIIVGRTAGEQSKEALFHREGYELSIVPDRVTIQAPTPQGAFYAMMTLKQILRQVSSGRFGSDGPSGGMPCLRIIDWPDFGNRGVLLDVSRGRVPTLDTLFRLIDFWAELKVNHVELYTEHTFAYQDHPEVWSNASPFTAGEMQEVDAYCKTRYIELVPNQNSFGHMERWLRLPKYAHLAECPNGWTTPNGIQVNTPLSLSPVVKETIPFLADLYDELLPNFSSKQFNVGCDETFDLGQGRSADLCRRKGTGKVYVDFLKKVHRLTSERGKTMLYWGDIVMAHPDLVMEVPTDAVALTWGYEADHPFEKECKAFSSAGITYYVCPGTSSWNSIGGRWWNAKANIENAAINGLRFGASGLLTTDWGDNGHFQQYPIALPGFVYGASLAWSDSASRNLPVADVLSIHLFRDPTGSLADALLSLEKASESLGVKLHNATVLSAAITDADYPFYRKALQKVSHLDVRECSVEIQRALENLRAATPQSDDAALLVDEVSFTGRLMLHGCRLTAERMSGEFLELWQLTEKVRQELAEELGVLIPEYRSLWTRRYRPGGLDGSAGRLERLLEHYRR